MKISPRLCHPLNFAALGGCLFRLYGRFAPEGRKILHLMTRKRNVLVYY